MIKVLIIITTKFETSGITKIILRYFNNISPNLIHFDFVVPNELNKEIKKCLTKKKSNYFVLKNRNTNPILYMINLKNIMKREKYDIVHTHGNSSTMFFEMYSAKKANIKVRIAHNHNTTCNHKIIDKLLRPLFYRNLTTCFSCGMDAGRWLFKDRDFCIIPNANDLENYRYNEKNRIQIRNKYNLNNKYVIGHVGRFNDQKNHEFIIDVFNEYLKTNNNASLILIGSGVNEEKVKNKIRKLGLGKYVIIPGEINNVNEWMSALDLFLLPSRYEGIPLTLIECQASGLPCIVSEFVSREVNITGLIHFEDISCDYSINNWLNRIESIKSTNRIKSSALCVEQLRNKGYDIITESNKMENLYFDLLKKYY